MKILFVLENYYPKIGGVETLFKSLIESLVDQGHEITLLTNKGLGGLPIVTNSPGLKLVRVPLINRYLFTFLAFVPAIFYARGKDLIHTTSYNAAVPAYIAAKILRKKIIITFHEVWGDLWKTLPYMNGLARFLHGSFEKMLLNFSFDMFIGVSQFTCHRLNEYGVEKSKIKLIYNGIDYAKIQSHKSNTNSEKYTISYFGRLGISKGLDLFIDAITLLKEQEDFQFNMIIPKFPKSFYDVIMKDVEQKGIQHKINFYHYLKEEELDQVLAATDAVVVPSYSEGFCFSAVESMAKGIAVISSGKGALKEVISNRHLVVDEFTGLAFAQCFKKAKKGEWNETALKQFHLEDTVNNYISLYKNLVS